MEKHSKLADIERLRLNRYNTKGPGAKRARPKPSVAKLHSEVEKLRSDVAKITKKAKKAKRRNRRA